MGGVASSVAETMSEKMSENMGKAMESQMSKQMAAQKSMQREMSMKAREIQMAMNLAKTKEVLRWYAAGVGGWAVLACLAAKKLKNPAPLIPLYPLGFVVAFQYDMVYGDKMLRIKADAEEYLRDPEYLYDRFVPPEGNLMVDKDTYIDIVKRD